MATFLYNSARQAFANEAIAWDTDEIHCALLSGAYGPSISDNFLTDIPGGALMVDAIMEGNTSVAGLCAGSVPEFDAFIADSDCVAVLIYRNSGDPSTSQLIYYSSDGDGFPFTPQGFNYAVGFDQTSGGFFQV